MLEQLAKQFIASGGASDAVSALMNQGGMDKGQAQGAVEATAEGAAEAVTEQGGIGALAGLLGGGGGLGAIAGALTGGGDDSGVPEALVAPVASFVASKTGLSPEMAQTAVRIVLPKVMDYFQGEGGDDGKGGDGGGGGLLGGLLG